MKAIDRKSLKQQKTAKMLAGAVVLLILFVTGCTSSPAPEEPTKDTLSSTLTSEETVQDEQSGSFRGLQRLQIANQSDISLHNLVVVFPDERIEFGDVPAGATTDYHEVPHGVYRYAAYDVEVNGQAYQQPVIDWIGETAVQGEDFTYLIEVDPSWWQREGHVIQLVQVREDQSTNISMPTPVTSPTAEVPLSVQTPSILIGKGSPTSLAVSADGQWMAVSTQFGVHLYDTSTFEESWFTPFVEKTGHVVFNRQSDRLGIMAGDAIVVLDVDTGDLLVQLEGVGGSFAWSPEGRRLVSGGNCQTVTIWDASKGTTLKELLNGKCSEGYSGIPVTWAADGRIYGVSETANILAWDGDTYTPIAGFSAEGVKDSWVSAILAAPAGSLLAQYDSMGYPTVAIIDGQQGRQVHLLYQQVNGRISALAWAPDGQHLAVAYGTNTGLILIWNAQTAQVTQKIEGFYATEGMGWSSDGQTLIGPQTMDGQINAIAVSTGRVLHSVGDHAPATFLTWTQDGLATTNGATITWWKPSSGELLRQETAGSPQARVISWPPTGQGTYLYTSPEQVYQVGTSSSKWPLISNDNQYPFPIAWSWDGKRLASPSGVWSAGTGELLTQLQDPAQQHAPDKVAWSPDGRRLASAESLNMQPPVIWDAQNGKVLLTLQIETGQRKPLWLGLAWSPDGKKLAGVGSLMHPAGGMDEGMILIWDVETGQQEQLLTAAMSDHRLWTVVWSPDSQFLACGTTGSELFVWNMVNHTPVAKLQGHRDTIDQLAWSPDGNHLASLARDGTLQIWDLSSFTSAPH